METVLLNHTDSAGLREWQGVGRAFLPGRAGGGAESPGHAVPALGRLICSPHPVLCGSVVLNASGKALCLVFPDERRRSWGCHRLP